MRGAWNELTWTGRCATVGVAIATAGAVAWWVGETPLAFATGLSILTLLLAAVVDAVERRLPNVVVAAAAVPVVVALAVTAPVTVEPVWSAMGGAAVIGGPLLLTHLLSPAGMGFGDVKAGLVLGAALGLVEVQVAFAALVLALAGTVAVAAVRRRRHVAFGPGLVAGAVAALLVTRAAGLEAIAWR